MRVGRFSSVMLRWVATYALIMLIPLISFGYGSYRSAMVLREEISESNRHTLDLLSEQIERMIGSVNSEMSYIAAQTSFADFCQARTMAEVMDRGTQLQKAVKRYAQSVDESISMMLYHDRFDYVLTPDSGTSAYAARLVQDTGDASENDGAWRQVVTATYPQPSYFISEGLRWNEHSSCFVCALSVRIYRSNVNIFVSLPMEAFNLSGFEDKLLLIVDKEGQIAYSSDESALPTGQRCAISGEPAQRLKYGGAEYICESCALGRTGMQCAMLADSRLYWDRLHRVYFVMGLLFVISLALSVILCLVFVRNNYHPVKKLLALTDAGNVRRDEFGHIESAIRSLQDDRETMRTELDAQSEQLKTYYILSALKGRRLPLADSDYQTQFGLEGDIAGWGLILMSISAEGEGPDAYVEEGALTRRLMDAFDGEADALPHDWIEDGRLTVCLIRLPKARLDDWEDVRSRTVERLLSVAEDSRAALRLIACGPVEAFGELRREYFDATSALSYLQTLGRAGAMTLAEYRALLTNDSLIRDDRWHSLLAAVQAGDPASVQRHAADLFGGSSGFRDVFFPALKMQLAVRLNDIVNACFDSVIAQEARQSLLADVERVMSSQDVESLQRTFCRTAVQAAKDIRQQLQDPGENLAARISDYVQAHYADPNLNISFISDVFHRNPQSVSRAFKAQTGIGLLDYINDVRVRRASELIKASDGSMEEIASRVGFSNARTFRRAFVKQYGVLPSDWR